jgi:hypothetical protein
LKLNKDIDDVKDKGTKPLTRQKTSTKQADKQDQ